MKRTLFVAAAVLAVTAFASGPDSYFVKVGTITTGAPDAGTASVAISSSGAYVKVSCVEDAYVATGTGTGLTCLLADGGLPCELVKFSAGEKFHCKAPVGQNRVTAYMPDAGIQACGVFEARN